MFIFNRLTLFRHSYSMLTKKNQSVKKMDHSMEFLTVIKGSMRRIFAKKICGESSKQLKVLNVQI